MDVMNVDIKEGDKVVFADPGAGLPADGAKAGALLKEGKTYTVERMEVHPARRDVYLKKFPDIAFNRKQFEKA